MRAALAVLVLVVGMPVLAADKPEPKYEGKPLAYWVQRFQKAENDKDRDAAVEALQAFGPDAAPALPAFIEMLADHSLTYRARVIGIIATIGPKAQSARPIIVKLVKDKKTAYFDDSIKAIVATSSDPKDAAEALAPLLEAPDRADAIYSALCELGPDAKGAIPAIRQYVLKELAAKEKDEKRNVWSLASLSKLGPDAVPLLVEMLDAHSGCGRDVALDCLQTLGPKATNAAPVLVKLLAHDDPIVRFRVAPALWAIDKNPAAVAALGELLKVDPAIQYAPHEYTQSVSVAVEAAKLLGAIGPDAKAALPQLRETAALGRALWLLAGGSDWPFDKPGSRVLIPIAYTETATDRQWRDIGDRIRVGVFAESAIDKIEQKPKK